MAEQPHSMQQTLPNEEEEDFGHPMTFDPAEMYGIVLLSMSPDDNPML